MGLLRGQVTCRAHCLGRNDQGLPDKVTEEERMNCRAQIARQSAHVDSSTSRNSKSDMIKQS